MSKFLFSILILFFISCSSADKKDSTSGSYFKSRGADFLDIFTFGIEKKMYGTHLKLMPFNLGFQFQNAREYKEFSSKKIKSKLGSTDSQISFQNGVINFTEKNISEKEDEEYFVENLDYVVQETKISLKDKSLVRFNHLNGFGLRGGQVGSYHSNQLVYGILGGESFYTDKFLTSDTCVYIEKDKQFEEYKIYELIEKDSELILYFHERNYLKSHDLKYVNIFNDKPKDRQKRQKEQIRKDFIKDLIDQKKESNPEQVAELQAYLPKEKIKPFGYPKTYLYQIEFTIGIYYGLRVGFNPSELLDFILGFTTYDLNDDDLNPKDKSKETNKIEFLKANSITENEKANKLKKQEESCRKILTKYFD